MWNNRKQTHFSILLAALLALVSEGAFSQTESSEQKVDVTFNKTSSIVFPANITSVDRGSRDVLAQKAKGVNNVLQLKAGKMNFRETNLTVITADGKLHQFVIRYADAPADFTIQALGDNTSAGAIDTPLHFKTEMTESELAWYADQIVTNTNGHRITSSSKHDMKMILKGIYIQGNIMFYHLKVVNDSNIPFHTDMLRFYVKDKKKPKRTASQEVDELPLYHYGSLFLIHGKTSEELVYALPKFTIPDAKTLHIEWMEKKGGRHLGLKVRNKSIIKAKAVPTD